MLFQPASTESFADFAFLYSRSSLRLIPPLAATCQNESRIARRGYPENRPPK